MGLGLRAFEDEDVRVHFDTQELAHEAPSVHPAPCTDALAFAPSRSGARPRRDPAPESTDNLFPEISDTAPAFAPYHIAVTSVFGLATS
ncbi:hypothetical protein B0H10DRAFT_2214252 [Mycena sp. CBHHK59/15]|nr:hypothetical protein B0H10DRAFT_2214252 [Mycena sp. CBHHK59/15]